MANDKEAVAKRITEISRNSAKNERDQQKMDVQLRKMEEAARLAYAEDMCRNADMSAQNHNRALAAAASASIGSGGQATIGPSLPGTLTTTATGILITPSASDGRTGKRQIDPLALPMDPQELAELEARRLAATRSENATGDPENPTLWCETVSEEGQIYYWNVKTNETVWDKPKQGYLTLDEYNNIMEQSRLAQQVVAERENKFLVDNADELAAKYNREKLKQRRAEYEAKQKEAKKKEDQQQRAQDRKLKKERREAKQEQRETPQQDDEEEDEQPKEYPPAAPFGKWQTVAVVPPAEQPYVDLQLPNQSSNKYQYVPPAIEEPKPKVFKEKVATLDQETTATESGVFKKRKINMTLKKNSRQRMDDY